MVHKINSKGIITIVLFQRRYSYLFFCFILSLFILGPLGNTQAYIAKERAAWKYMINVNYNESIFFSFFFFCSCFAQSQEDLFKTFFLVEWQCMVLRSIHSYFRSCRKNELWNDISIVNLLYLVINKTFSQTMCFLCLFSIPI